jgi:GNAT superfamily N-acetyltransferase
VNERGAAVRLLAAGLLEDGLSVDLDLVARAVEFALSRAGSAWLVVALSRGLPVGVLLANPVVSVEHGGAALRLEAVCVQAPSRGRGVEAALVEFLVAEARNNGITAVEAEVAGPGSEAALAGLGFSPLDRRRLRRIV